MRPQFVPSGQQFELALGDQRAVVTEVGAGLRTYSVGGREVVDGYRIDQICPSGRGQVLVPWPNRIAGGTYEFEGRRHQLPLNEAEHGNAIHGLVRWSAWAVGDQAADQVALAHRLRPQPGYPFELALTVEYRLSPSGLSVRTTAANTGDKPCPYAAGAHPYLTRGRAPVDSLKLLVPARAVVVADERGIPLRSAPVDGGELDFTVARPIGPTRLDNAFTNLARGDDGVARATLSDDAGGVELWAGEGYTHLMVFTGDPLPDVNRRAVAIEPMTCAPNAFRSGGDVIRLEAGQSVSHTWGISMFSRTG